MSWNLLIYKPGEDGEELEPLGTLPEVSGVLNNAFPALEWDSSAEAVLPLNGGFRLELSVENGVVKDIYTSGGFNHMNELVALCKQQGWRIADAQEGEDVDLEDPYKWYKERGG